MRVIMPVGHCTKVRVRDGRLPENKDSASGHDVRMPTTIMFAGGTSYTEDLLFRMVADSIATDREAEIETHRRTFTHAAQRPTVYMPSHDADSAIRPADRIAIEPLGTAPANPELRGEVA